MLNMFNTRYQRAMSTMAITLALSTSVLADIEYRYVNAAASLGGDGLSWATAHRYLQDGLESARVHLSTNQFDTVQIWVVAGTYRPDLAEDDVEGQPVVEDDPTETFKLRNQVEIYGGFTGDHRAVQ